METKAPLRPRFILLALGLGAVPGLASAALGQDILQPWDLGLSAVILLAALLLASNRLSPAFQAAEIRIPFFLVFIIALVPTAFLDLVSIATVTNDERAYLMQAELFTDGELSEPLASSPASAWALNRRQVLEIPPRKTAEGFQAGKRYPKYSPGTGLGLVPGTFLGWPWLSVALMAVFDLLLLAAIGKKLSLGHRTLAPLLLATSPFFLLVHTSFQSEVFTLPAALLGWLALLHTRSPHASKVWPLLLGASAGWIFLCRPLTGVLFAFAALPGLWVGPQASKLRGTAGAILGGLPFLALALAYNVAQTGDFFLSPYEVYAEIHGPWNADGTPRDVYGNGDVWGGLLRQMGRWSVTFFSMLGGIGLGLWGLWRHRRVDGGSGFSFALLLPVAYAFHWYPGHWGYLGPLYAFESLGVLLVGALLLLADAPPVWRRSLILTSVSFGLIFFNLRLPELTMQQMHRSAPERAAKVAETGSVVLLPWVNQPALREKGVKLSTPDRPPFSDQRVVIIRENPTPEATRKALVELGLQDRKVYRFVPDSTSSGSLTEIDIP